jgi:hypothetical protein
MDIIEDKKAIRNAVPKSRNAAIGDRFSLFMAVLIMLFWKIVVILHFKICSYIWAK